MRKILFSAFIILSVLLIGSSSLAFGEMMNSNVGVANGDVFRYSYKCNFNSNGTSAALPASFSWINQTDYFMVNVTEVNGTSINFSTNMRGLNGTNSLGVCAMNVETGTASISGYGGPTDASSFYFMARNVGMMGRMFPSSNSNPTINDTLMMTYAGGQRLTNHFSMNSIQNGMRVNSDFYFDQSTGMMVEWRQVALQTGTLQSNITQVMKMTSSSVWVVPEFPASFFLQTFLVVAVFSGLAVMAVIKVKRSHSTPPII